MCGVESVDAGLQLAKTIRDGTWETEFPEISFERYELLQFDPYSKLDVWRRHFLAYEQISNAIISGDEFSEAVVIPAGSFTKGTPSTPHSSDLDILVLFPDFTPEKYDQYLVLFCQKKC